MKQKTIEVLMVEPRREPRIVRLDNSLESLQTAVSIGADYRGLIEIISLSDEVCILCNEEGKLIGLEPNRRLWSDVLCGVFYVTGQDKPYHPQAWKCKWQRFTDAHDLEHIRFHDLRHSHATALIESGVSMKAVQDRMGHSNISTTMDIYAHCTTKMQKDAGDRIDEILFSGKEGC